MSTQTTEQQNALKDAMARAKEIAARLQQNNEESVAEKPDTTEKPDTLEQPDTNDDLSETESGKRKAFGESDEQPELKKVAPPLPLMPISEPPSKKIFGPMLVEEISLPNNIMGLVMGKGGTMINKLQVASGTKLQVSSEEISDHRLVTITGNAEAVSKAKGFLEEIQSTGKVPDQLLMDPDAFNSEMSIPKEKAGLVIGRGGEMIKSLMERAGCKIVLIQDGPYADAPEKLLRFSGEQDSVMYGKQLVQDLLANKLGNMTNRMPPQGGEYMEINVPKEAIGLIIGTRGSNIQELQQQTGCKVQFQKEMQGNFKVCTLSGTPEQVETASNMINEMIRTGDSGFGPPMMNGPPQPRWGGPPRGPPMGPRGPPNWGPQHPGPRPRMQRGPGPRAPPGHKSLYLEVPANKCGLVIGKGGETIKQIKGESQANIQLDRSIPDESPFRVLRMNGADEAIDMAVQMIRDRIDDQSLIPKNEATDGPPGQGGSNQWGGQDQWGGQNQGNWGPPQDNNQQWGDQWNQQQQWGGQQQQQSGWGAAQQPQQQGGWGQQQQGGNQAWDQQQSWNQPQQQQQPQSFQQQPPQQTQPQQQSQQAPKPQQQNQQGQQWQPQSSTASAQWPNQQQQQWSQSAATSTAQTSQAYQQASTAPASTSTTTSDTSQTQAGSQPQQDYSAAWALYYQQQQQYYQQYYAQQAQAAAAAAVSAGATSTASTVSTQGTANNSQATTMAQYQAQYAEYQKQYGQQQQQAPQ